MLQRIGMALLSLVAASVLLSMTHPAASAPNGQTRYVDPINGNDTTGTGSLAAPWRSLKRALQSAVAGDTVNALAGTYGTATGETFPINWPPGVKLTGAGRDVVIIQGQSNQPVIYIGSASTDFYSDTVISGVTVKGGSEGIYLYSSRSHVNAVTLLNLQAINNTNGIRIRTGEDYQNGATVTPLISNTEALSNTNQGFYFGGYGYFAPSSVRPEVINCTARGNGAHGMYVDSAAPGGNGTTVAPHVVGSDFSYNHGSGVYATASYQGWASPQIERSTLIGNGAYGFFWVAGYNTANGAPAIANTLVARNHAGGLYLGNLNPYYSNDGVINVINNTIVDNEHYGIYWVPDGKPLWPQVINTILWNPAADDLFSTSTAWTTANVEYSDIEDGDLNAQSGNFSSAPLFDETYHLIACSTAIDAGKANGAPSVDFDGELRPQGLAPDVGMDELGTPCLLRSSKAVSASRTRYGDVLTYTLQITNVTPVTTMNVILTDVLPSAVIYVPSTLSASRGIPKYQTGMVTWAGALVPSETVTISLAARAVRSTTVLNRFATEAVGFGTFKSPSVATTVDPVQCYLPLTYRNYCAGPLIDDFSNLASGWPIAETSYWSYGYAAGEYRFYAKRSATGTVTRGDRTGRFIVEADARQLSTVNGSFGLVFQLNDDWTNFYTFEIYPATQEWALFQFAGNQWYLLTYGASSAIQLGQGTNRLRIAWVRQTGVTDDYGLYANGQLLYMPYVSAPTPVRRVGLTAASDGAGFEVRFDNYKFVAEGCPEFAASSLSSTVVVSGEKPSPDRLPAVWQARLQARSSSVPRINQGVMSLSEWVR